MYICTQSGQEVVATFDRIEIEEDGATYIQAVSNGVTIDLGKYDLRSVGEIAMAALIGAMEEGVAFYRMPRDWYPKGEEARP